MSKELIACTLYSLEQMEFGGKALPAKPQLEERLGELVEGRRVPLVVFNCLEFSWRPAEKRGKYPQSIVSCKPEVAVCKYFGDEIGVVKLELGELGTMPDLKVIVPDSELLDDRVFSFAQSRTERLDLAFNSREALATQLSGLNDPASPVILWSDYCQQLGLKSPMEYTAENFNKIEDDPKLQRKVKDQIKDSARYLERSGISMEDVNLGEVYQRTAWYLAMYMGEGEALKDNRAICLNLEDGRVPAWFQRGAGGMLPIITPVDPKDFYNWRSGMNVEQK